MDEKDTLTPYEQLFVEELDAIKNLFLEKNRNYNPDESPFANFAIGGFLLAGDVGMRGSFEALKAYVAKHIANIYAHTIDQPGIEDPLRDIATYMIIALIMKKENSARYVETMRKEAAQKEQAEAAKQAEIDKAVKDAMAANNAQVVEAEVVNDGNTENAD